MGWARNRSPSTPSTNRLASIGLGLGLWGSAGLALIGAGVLAAPALAAEVTGKLLLATYKVAPVASDAQAFHWEIENGVKEVAPQRVDAKRELAVVLVGEGKTVMPDRIEVAFSGGGLLPSTIIARPGSTLMFSNQDEFAHELYAEGKGGFAAEATSPRGRRTIPVKTEGTLELRDQLVPHLTGIVVVVPNAIAVASPDASGQFTFPEIEPGQYTLKVFHGKAEIASQPIEVGAKELVIDPLTLAAKAAK